MTTTTTRHDDLQTTPQGVAEITTTPPCRCIICATALERPRQRLYCGVKCNRRAAMARAKLAEAKAAAGRVEAVPTAQPQRVTAQVQPINVMINVATGTTPAAAEVAAAMMSEIIVQRLSPPTSPPPSLPRRIGRRIAAAWHTFCFYLVSLNTD